MSNPPNKPQGSFNLETLLNILKRYEYGQTSFDLPPTISPQDAEKVSQFIQDNNLSPEKNSELKKVVKPKKRPKFWSGFLAALSTRSAETEPED